MMHSTSKTGLCVTASKPGVATPSADILPLAGGSQVGARTHELAVSAVPEVVSGTKPAAATALGSEKIKTETAVLNADSGALKSHSTVLMPRAILAGPPLEPPRVVGRTYVVAPRTIEPQRHWVATSVVPGSGGAAHGRGVVHAPGTVQIHTVVNSLPNFSMLGCATPAVGGPIYVQLQASHGRVVLAPATVQHLGAGTMMAISGMPAVGYSANSAPLPLTHAPAIGQPLAARMLPEIKEILSGSLNAVAAAKRKAAVVGATNGVPVSQPSNGGVPPGIDMLLRAAKDERFAHTHLAVSKAVDSSTPVTSTADASKKNESKPMDAESLTRGLKMSLPPLTGFDAGNEPTAKRRKLRPIAYCGSLAPLPPMPQFSAEPRSESSSESPSSNSLLRRSSRRRGGSRKRTTRLAVAGASCHQCKNKKTWEHIAFCTRYKGDDNPLSVAVAGRTNRCRQRFCKECLTKYTTPSELTRLMETQSLLRDDARIGLLSVAKVWRREYPGHWLCPVCEDKCSCASCLRKREQSPV